MSVLPPQEVPAFSTTVFLDSENAFYWAHPSPKSGKTGAGVAQKERLESLRLLYRTEFGIDHALEDLLHADNLMRLGPAVFTTFANWVRNEWGDVDLRSYGKREDPASRLLCDLVDVAHWVHVNVSRDKDAADRALAKDLEDRSRRSPRQVFVIVSSDKHGVLAWSLAVSQAAPQHEYRVVLGSRLIAPDDLKGLRYEGTMSELFGQVVSGRKRGPVSSPRLTGTRAALAERRRRARLAPEMLQAALLDARDETTFGEILRNRCNDLQTIPASHDRRAASLWKSWGWMCLDAWRARFPDHGGLPDYASATSFERLLQRVVGHLPVQAMIAVAKHAIQHTDGAGRAELDALNAVMAAKVEELGPNRSHL